MFCTKCGKEILDENALFCPFCGEEVKKNKDVNNNSNNNESAKVEILSRPEESDKSRLVALLLCLIVGTLGIHRFYVGKIGTGILWLLTAGCFGVGLLVDLIMIICGAFTDKDNKKVTNWNVD